MPASHLRPLSFGEILDGAFTLYRRHFATFFTTALIPLLPVAVLYGLLGVASAGSASEEPGLSDALFLVALPFMLLGTMLVWGALVWETAEAVEGREPSRGEAYRAAFRRLLPLVGVTLVMGFLVVLGFVLLVVPGILAMIMLFAVWPAVMIEKKGPFEAVSRSRALADGAWGRIFGVSFVVYLIVMMPGMLTSMVAAGAMAGVVIASGGAEAGLESIAWITAVSQVANVLISALTTPFMIAAMTLLYYDRRVRTEGLDLEMAEDGLPALS